MTTATADEQTALWNGPAGQAWVDTQVLLDAVLAPMEALLTAEVAARQPEALLDVGCGTGATTLAATRRLGAAGSALGVDISEPMIAVARRRAEQERLPARFVAADAQRHGFAAAGIDMLISRFGVMFFDDFAAAFANLRRAARDRAELRFITWRSPAENPFMTAAERAAGPLLPDLPRRDPAAPGQFGLADRDRAWRALAEGGWAAIDLQPVDFACSFPAAELERYFTNMGPVAQALKQVDAATRDRVMAALRTAFEGFVTGAEVEFTAACWLVSARAG